MATICASSGSTPRSAGSRMLLLDGVFSGTIGGGALEGQVMERMRSMALCGGSALVDFHLSNADAGASGMVCGGSCRVLVERVDPGEEQALLFAELAGQLEAGRGAVLRTEMDSAGGAVRRTVYSGPEPDPAHAFEETPEGFEFFDFVFPAPRVVFAGAGHVAQATAALAHEVGFDVIVLDDRAEFADRARFPFARLVRAVPEYARCFDDLHLGAADMVCIMTRGHGFDGAVLGQALKTGAGYVGMIGSSRKRESIYAKLRGEGASEAELARVHCPIGLAIGARTPAEIGVSIVAQLISLRERQC